MNPRILPLHLFYALGGIFNIALVPIFVHMVESDAVVIGIIRLIIAITGLALLNAFRQKQLNFSLQQWLALAAIGICFGLHWLTYFLAIKFSTPSIAVIGICTYGIHLLILNWLLNQQKPKPRHVVAIVLAIFGSLMIVPEFSLANSVTLGLLLGISSGLFYAAVPLLHQRQKGIPDHTRTMAQFGFGLMFFALLAPFGDWNIPPTDWPYLIVMGVVCTLIGHSLWVKATTVLPIPVISCIFYLGLPITMVLEWFVLQQVLMLQSIIGAGIVLFSNMITIDWSQSRNAASPMEEFDNEPNNINKSSRTSTP